MHRRGFTLIELMIVIAIVGIMSAIGTAAIINLVKTGRLNSAGGGLARLLTDARVRAMTQHCPHFVQVNGMTYAATTGLKSKATATLVRKYNCNFTPSSTAPFSYSPGSGAKDTDRVLMTLTLGEPTAANNGLHLRVDTPATGFGAGQDVLTKSFIIGYDATGARFLSSDTAGNGTFSEDTSATGDLVLRFAPDDTATTGVPVTVPLAGVASRG